MKASKLGILVLSGILVALLVLAGGCADREATGVSTQIIEDVTTEEAYALIQDNQDNQSFVILDVRTPGEYAGGHIAEAINLDYNSGTFREEVNELDKDKTYLIYCRTARRSGLALDIMEELGFGEVYNMLGGIVEWEADGFPMVK